MAGFRVIELPGPRPGQIGLWRESDRLALSSDCFYTIDMWGRDSAPRLPAAVYNYDTEQARASMRKLAALEPAAAWPGHAKPAHRRRAQPARTGRRRGLSVGRRARRQRTQPRAPGSDYTDAEGNVLTPARLAHGGRPGASTRRRSPALGARPSATQRTPGSGPWSCCSSAWRCAG